MDNGLIFSLSGRRQSILKIWCHGNVNYSWRGAQQLSTFGEIERDTTVEQYR